LDVAEIVSVFVGGQRSTSPATGQLLPVHLYDHAMSPNPATYTRKPREARLRSDAERNRELILAAARRVYSTDGLDASLASVAREARVGIATLFRRFPSREDLIAAAFSDTMDAYLAAVDVALADPDPWHAFTHYVDTICAMQAADRGVADLLTMTFSTAEELRAKQRKVYRGFATVVKRAQQHGRLRPDFTTEDFVILLMANSGVIAATAADAPDTWRRLVGYLIQAFAVQGPAAEAELPRGPRRISLRRAMLRLGGASDEQIRSAGR
jgi:AcrR family transcriptional regulator